MDRWVGGLVMLALGAPPASGQIKGTRGRVQVEPATTLPGVVRTGERVAMTLKAYYHDVEPGAELYVAILPMDGERGVLNGTKLSAKNPVRFDYCANFKNDTGKVFNIEPANYPLSASLALGTIFQAFGVPPEQLGDQKDLKTDITMAFIAAFGRGGDGVVDGSLEFRPVMGTEYYDGILLAPMLVRRENAQRCANFDSDRLNTLRIAFDPGVARPPDKASAPSTPKVTVGRLEVTALEPAGAELVVGQQNTLRVTVAYEQLPPNAEVYVMLLAVRGDTVVRSDRQLLTSRDGSKFGMDFETCKLEQRSGGFRISDENRPVYLEMPYIERLEAAAVGRVPSGGSGRTSGLVRFTPPPWEVFYDGIDLQPIVVWRAEDGRLCAKRDNKTMPGRVVAIAGRRFR